MISHLLWLLLWAGGETSLSAYLDFETYFTSRDIAYTAEALSGLLQEEKIDPAVIDGWVKKLGADEFDDREAASLALTEIGEPARAVLQGAARSRDPETAFRASELLKKLPEVDEELTKTNRALALFALGRLRDPATRPLLENFAKAEASLEQRMARLALSAWDRKPEAPAPAVESKNLWAAFPADAAAVARFAPVTADSVVKEAMRKSERTQAQLLGLFLRVGELHFHRVTVAVGADSLKKDVPERAWVTAVVEGEMDPQLLGAWLNDLEFEETEVDGRKHYQKETLRIVPVSAQMLLVMQVKGEGGPDPAKVLSGLRGEDSAAGLDAKLREQLPPAAAEPPVWLRFAAPADFETELLWLRGLQRGAMNGQRDPTGGFTFEISGGTADEEAAKSVLAGVQVLADQRVSRIRNPSHPIMVPVVQLWRSLGVGHEAERVWIKGAMTQEYFQSLHQQSERSSGGGGQPMNRNIMIQQMQMNNRIQIQAF